MIKNSLLSLIILCVFFSCDHQSQQENAIAKVRIEKIYPPFDTATVIKNLNIQDENLSEISIDKNAKSLDTVRLTSVAYACDCPTWVVSNKWTGDYGNFDLPKYGYWIEPLNTEVKLPDNLGHHGNKILLVGKILKVKRKPANPTFGSKEEYKVFEYHGYKILKPYKLFGPKVPTGDVGADGDSNWMSSVLDVKE